MAKEPLVNRRNVLAGTGIITAGVVVAACSPGTENGANPDIKGAGVAPSGTVLTAVADVPVGGGLVLSDPPIVRLRMVSIFIPALAMESKRETKLPLSELSLIKNAVDSVTGISASRANDRN